MKRDGKPAKVKHHLNAQNPHLTHYPQMLDELLKYVFIPPKVADAYRAHLASTTP